MPYLIGSYMSFDPIKFRVAVFATKKRNSKVPNQKFKAHKKSLATKIALKLDEPFPIGKYKGKTPREVIRFNPGYISYFNQNTRYYVAYSIQNEQSKKV